MKEQCGNHFILNGRLQSAGTFDSNLVYKGDSVYEVIRMIKGIPVFFNDHIERLNTSLRLQHKRSLASPERLKEDIMLLSGAEKKREINIKIVFNYFEERENYLIYYIESTYPADYQYINGVRGILFYGERTDPGSKVINYSFRSKVHQELVNEGAYEVLLVNNDNKITEGSKSNIFLIKGDTLYTAPDDMVLCGITRKHVTGICKEEGLEIVFSCVDADELGEYDSVFMTGTSPGVLAFSSVNEYHFRAGHKLVGSLNKLYRERVEENILSFSK